MCRREDERAHSRTHNVSIGLGKAGMPPHRKRHDCAIAALVDDA
jgi:hypothetical protein